MLKPLIEKLIRRENLSEAEMRAALEEILVSDNAAQVAAFLVLLRAKGETADEFYAFVEGMRTHMNVVNCAFPVLDIVGTGGDQSNSVNISSAASILAATCGVKVLKHGNRSVSSKCGSADFIESLGVNLTLSSQQLTDSLLKVGMAFAFAPEFHPSMKKVMPIRSALGIRTLFNFLGPLLNPATPEHLLLGVFPEDRMDLFADVVMRLPTKHALVVHSCGLDELSLLGSSHVIEIKNKQKKAYTIEPEFYGFKRCQLSDIQGGDVKTNKRLLLAALSGETGVIADTIVLNTGAALYAADDVASIEEGIEKARAVLSSGAALKVIDNWASFSKQEGA